MGGDWLHHHATPFKFSKEKSKAFIQTKRLPHVLQGDQIGCIVSSVW
jgi:hypothetical protein